MTCYNKTYLRWKHYQLWSYAGFLRYFDFQASYKHFNINYHILYIYNSLESWNIIQKNPRTIMENLLMFKFHNRFHNWTLMFRLTLEKLILLIANSLCLYVGKMEIKLNSYRRKVILTTEGDVQKQNKTKKTVSYRAGRKFGIFENHSSRIN